MLNLNLKGIQKKLLNKADWLAFGASAYTRWDGDINSIIKHFTTSRVIEAVTDSFSGLDRIRYRLLNSPHAYTQIFKMGIYAYIAAELGIVPSKYKKPIEKILWGSGIAALTLPASPPSEMESTLRSRGSSGNSETWKYQA